MRRSLLTLLAHLARAIVRRQQPTIVGVTGSVGKTSAREAIRVVLAVDRDVRSAPKNYNNEIGFPIAIIGGYAPGRSPVAWVSAIARGVALAGIRALRYPETLILEYGADRPGDLAYLLRIATPTIAVVTAVGPAHVAAFGSVERIAAEKRRLVAALPRDGVAILNHDDAAVLAMRERTRTRAITYGFHADADIRAIEDRVTTDAQGIANGIACKVLVGGSAVPVHLLGCVGRAHVSAALAGVAVGIAMGMHLVEISHALRAYLSQPGRMRLIPGVRRTMLIDDTYNASPLAVASALMTLRTLPGATRRIAVLGDMLELGLLTEREHAHMGELAAASELAHLVTVGALSAHLANAARDTGMPGDRIAMFASAAEAGRYVQGLLAPGDVVLVKGSQGMRMERVVKELMADPLQADLLCRQDSAWLRRWA